jgi:hypothetical protein
VHRADVKEKLEVGESWRERNEAEAALFIHSAQASETGSSPLEKPAAMSRLLCLSWLFSFTKEVPRKTIHKRTPGTSDVSPATMEKKIGGPGVHVPEPQQCGPAVPKKIATL